MLGCLPAAANRAPAAPNSRSATTNHQHYSFIDPLSFRCNRPSCYEIVTPTFSALNIKWPHSSQSPYSRTPTHIHAGDMPITEPVLGGSLLDPVEVHTLNHQINVSREGGVLWNATVPIA